MSSADMPGSGLLVALVALVAGHTIGSGIFGPLQNMSGSAGANAILTARGTAP